MKHIRFTKSGHCNALGNFGPGDTARVDDAFAAHLVTEAECAEYIASLPVEPTPVAVLEVPVVDVVQPIVEPPRRGRPRKDQQ